MSLSLLVVIVSVPAPAAIARPISKLPPLVVWLLSAAAVAAAQEGGGADADAAPAGLDAAESAPPPEPSLYQRAMPYVIGAYIVYTLASRFLGKEEEPEQAGARAGGARRAARAPAAAAR
jgi:hypothetical protein